MLDGCRSGRSGWSYWSGIIDERERCSLATPLDGAALLSDSGRLMTTKATEAETEQGDAELTARLKALSAEMNKVIEMQRRAELQWLIAEQGRIAKRIELLTSILDGSAFERATTR